MFTQSCLQPRGYGALYFADALKLDKVITFSPQFSIDPNIVPFESRWSKVASTISFTHSQMTKSNAIEAIVIYDPFDRLDEKHIKLIRQKFPEGQTLTLPFTGHPSISALNECGQLKQTVELLLNDQDINLNQIRRIVREKSNQYPLNIIYRSLPQGAQRTTRIFNMLVQYRKSDKSWILKQGIKLIREFNLRGWEKEASSIALTLERTCDVDQNSLSHLIQAID